VFDIPGCNRNSIECARESKLFDVLIYASEDKELGDAQYLDYEMEKTRAK
jgi:hypothetical protein